MRLLASLIISALTISDVQANCLGAFGELTRARKFDNFIARHDRVPEYKLGRYSELEPEEVVEDRLYGDMVTEQFNSVFIRDLSPRSKELLLQWRDSLISPAMMENFNSFVEIYDRLPSCVANSVELNGKTISERTLYNYTIRYAENEHFLAQLSPRAQHLLHWRKLGYRSLPIAKRFNDFVAAHDRAPRAIEPAEDLSDVEKLEKGVYHIMLRNQKNPGFIAMLTPRAVEILNHWRKSKPVVGKFDLKVAKPKIIPAWTLLNEFVAIHDRLPRRSTRGTIISTIQLHENRLYSRMRHALIDDPASIAKLSSRARELFDEWISNLRRQNDP